MIRFFLLFFSLILFSMPYAIFTQFGHAVTIEQILFHLSLGFEGLKGTDSTILFVFFKNVLFVPMLFVILYTFFFIFRKKSSLFIKIVKSKKIVFSVFTFATLFFVVQMKVVDFVKVMFGHDAFSSLYSSPAQIQFAENKNNKKNLIVIYFESLENDLKNKEIYGVNLIDSVDKLEGVHIPKFFPAPGTIWSMAGMVASQCSIPLKPYYPNFINKEQHFLPNITCLGDVLNRYGYTQYFLVGHNLKMTGMDKFYKNHGYDFGFGEMEWRKKGLPPTSFHGFGDGLNDDALLDEAKKIITENQLSHKSFNLTLLTTDTHSQNGFPSIHCSTKELTEGFQGAFQCSSKFVANFIQDLQTQNLLKNTLVVILGDHPFMESPEKTKLFPRPRYVYIKFIDPDKRQPQRDLMTHFDVAASILDLMDLLPADSKFGLGFSVFSEPKIDYAQYFNEVSNKNILNRSSTYNRFNQMTQKNHSTHQARYGGRG